MPAHIVHAIAWNDHRDRSLVPWLLLVPLTGALLAAEAVDALAYDRHPIPLVLASGVPVVVAIMLGSW